MLLVFWPRGFWDLSSPTRDWTGIPCIGRWSLNHWTAREVPAHCFLSSQGSVLPKNICMCSSPAWHTLPPDTWMTNSFTSFFFFFFLAMLLGMWDLSSLTRDQPVPPALEVQNLNHSLTSFRFLSTVTFSMRPTWLFKSHKPNQSPLSGTPDLCFPALFSYCIVLTAFHLL